MKTSQRGIDLIKQYEGFSDVPYICPAGLKTIGYGHVILPKEDYKVISLQLGESILKADLEKFEKEVSRLVTVPINQNQFDALVSFCYNAGPANLAKSTLLKFVNAGNFKAAELEFGKWVNGGGKKLPGLVKRRQSEAKLFSEVV